MNKFFAASKAIILTIIAVSIIIASIYLAYLIAIVFAVTGILIILYVLLIQKSKPRNPIWTRSKER